MPMLIRVLALLTIRESLVSCSNQEIRVLALLTIRESLVRVILTRTLHDTSGCTINFGTNDLVLRNITVTVTI